VAGPSSLEVFARTSTTNLELIATLYDVAPDGTEDLITFGVVLGSQRDLDPDRSWHDQKGTSVRPYTTQVRDTYLKPGRKQKFSIALHPHLWSIKPGHALRLRFTTKPSADACKVDGGVGVLLPCRPTRPQRATLRDGVFTIQWSPKDPSAIHLPLLPYRCYETAASRVTARSGGAMIPAEWSSSADDC
jgi:predicted acyl esterase